jgi:hypothetical protein
LIGLEYDRASEHDVVSQACQHGIEVSGFHGCTESVHRRERILEDAVEPCRERHLSGVLGLNRAMRARRKRATAPMADRR